MIGVRGGLPMEAFDGLRAGHKDKFNADLLAFIKS
ncbi:hypothetical protein QFZ47_005635 [Variovorax paradoxus]|nr:hypothetical protein [Variovorax paradoxus]